MVLDTHVWIWLVTGHRKLANDLIEEIAVAEAPPVLSAISLWEAHLLMERGAIGLVATPEATIRAWLRTYPLEVAPIDGEVALLSRTLQFSHDDPADRFIAATAFNRGLPLATADEVLQSLPWLRCRSV